MTVVVSAAVVAVHAVTAAVVEMDTRLNCTVLRVVAYYIK